MEKKMTKRYILLVGRNYYPRGWYDFVGTFDSIEDAKEFAEVYRKDSIHGGKDKWAQILDTYNMELISECSDFSPASWS